MVAASEHRLELNELSLADCSRAVKIGDKRLLRTLIQEAAVFSSKYPFVHINHQGISRFAFYDPGLAHHIGRQHIMRFITETCLLFYYGQWAMLIGGFLCAHSQKTGPVRRSAHETRGEKEARTL